MEKKLGGLEEVDKVRETGISKMVIGDMLCLFAYIACPILLLPLVCGSQLQINEVGKGQRQVW